MTENIENIINLIQNEPTIWDTNLNASEKEKELAWSRICDLLGCKFRSTFRSFPHFQGQVNIM